jgi:hypothetical protein
MNQHRNFVGDPYLECCGYNHAIEEDLMEASRKKNIVGLAFTALMVIGIAVAVGWAYKKVK